MSKAPNPFVINKSYNIDESQCCEHLSPYFRIDVVARYAQSSHHSHVRNEETYMTQT